MAEKEYIEREAIEKAFAEEIRTNYLDDYAKGFQAALLAIMSIPSSDVAPVHHGRWLSWEEMFPDKTPRRKNNLGVFCSKCKLHNDNRNKYCPNCGAKMDGDLNE